MKKIVIMALCLWIFGISAVCAAEIPQLAGESEFNQTAEDIALGKNILNPSDIINNIKDMIADEITEALETKKPTDRYCEKCIHSKTLIVTYVGENPNLCQRGRPKGDAINCPYYTEGEEMYDKTDYSTITKAFR